MSGFKRRVRGGGLAISGVLSVVLGILLADRLVQPTVIEEIRTPVLMGLLALFVLPVLTFFAVRQDARAVRETAPGPAGDGEAGGEAPPSAGAVDGVRVVRHGARARSCGASLPSPGDRGRSAARD